MGITMGLPETPYFKSLVYPFLLSHPTPPVTAQTLKSHSVTQTTEESRWTLSGWVVTGYRKGEDNENDRL